LSRNHPVRDLPRHLSVDEAARRVAAGSLRLRPQIPTGVGHCLLIRRTVLDLIGPFDETFAPGYGEEVDFCQRAVAHGFRHVAADDVFTFHQGGASFGRRAEVLARRARNEDLVRARYPWFEAWVRRAELDRASPLALATAAARRSLLGLTVGIDALCLGPDSSGTMVNTIETIRALARRPEIDRLVAFVPFETPGVVRGLQAELPSVDFVGIRTTTEIPEASSMSCTAPIRSRSCTSWSSCTGRGRASWSTSWTRSPSRTPRTSALTSPGPPTVISPG
jgi:hypothetical protein